MNNPQRNSLRIWRLNCLPACRSKPSGEAGPVSAPHLGQKLASSDTWAPHLEQYAMVYTLVK
jgi:hypothetical protein